MRVASFTIDVEQDYGTGNTYHSLEDRPFQQWFRDYLSREKIPLTAFCTGQLVCDQHPIIDFLVEMGANIELHSFHHDPQKSDDILEVHLAKQAYTKTFRKNPRGWRAPQGRIKPKILTELHHEGFIYDSSIFPTPWLGAHGWGHTKAFSEYLSQIPKELTSSPLIEIPMAVINSVKFVFSISYVNLLGTAAFEFLAKRFGLPEICVIDSHFHDFVPSTAVQNLHPFWKFIYKENRCRGIKSLAWMVAFLKKNGYEFLPMDEVARLMSERKILN